MRSRPGPFGPGSESEKGVWPLLSSRTIQERAMSGPIVYKGRVFSVEVDKVILSNGHEAELAIVRHRPSVVLIPVQDDGQVVMIRQYRHALERDIWELPAGNMEEGESAEAAAARECEEEMGQVPTKVERLR